MFSLACRSLAALGRHASPLQHVIPRGGMNGGDHGPAARAESWLNQRYRSAVKWGQARQHQAAQAEGSPRCTELCAASWTMCADHLKSKVRAAALPQVIAGTIVTAARLTALITVKTTGEPPGRPEDESKAQSELRPAASGRVNRHAPLRRNHMGVTLEARIF